MRVQIKFNLKNLQNTRDKARLICIAPFIHTQGNWFVTEAEKIIKNNGIKQSNKNETSYKNHLIKNFTMQYNFTCRQVCPETK